MLVPGSAERRILPQLAIFAAHDNLYRIRQIFCATTPYTCSDTSQFGLAIVAKGHYRWRTIDLEFTIRVKASQHM